ncbi:hypothetical protein G3545_29115 [Starkeya sp. ORNL1]|uniref:hypothetical protein n=1 Tax=Starkeya sp. ORNL1 TaxID=2709380 RepID=UPI0014647622|nr:hypothetical protein [Starkeya sp. ORNL1]QJP17346.1 hypothetical protein G3545_29115 [Starkeya sp. ORNL1]
MAIQGVRMSRESIINTGSGRHRRLGFTPAALLVAAFSLAGLHEAEAARCGNPARFRSVDGGPKINIVIVNKSGQYRNVDWIDRNGRLVSMGSVPAGGSFPMSTWDGHTFMLTDGPGNCVEMFRASAGNRQVVLRAKSSGSGPE